MLCDDLEDLLSQCLCEFDSFEGYPFLELVQEGYAKFQSTLGEVVYDGNKIRDDVFDGFELPFQPIMRDDPASRIFADYPLEVEVVTAKGPATKTVFNIDIPHSAGIKGTYLSEKLWEVTDQLLEEGEDLSVLDPDLVLSKMGGWKFYDPTTPPFTGVNQESLASKHIKRIIRGLIRDFSTEESSVLIYGGEGGAAMLRKYEKRQISVYMDSFDKAVAYYELMKKRRKYCRVFVSKGREDLDAWIVDTIVQRKLKLKKRKIELEQEEGTKDDEDHDDYWDLLLSFQDMNISDYDLVLTNYYSGVDVEYVMYECIRHDVLCMGVYIDPREGSVLYNSSEYDGNLFSQDISMEGLANGFEVLSKPYYDDREGVYKCVVFVHHGRIEDNLKPDLKGSISIKLSEYDNVIPKKIGENMCLLILNDYGMGSHLSVPSGSLDILTYSDGNIYRGNEIVSVNDMNFPDGRYSHVIKNNGDSVLIDVDIPGNYLIRRRWLEGLGYKMTEIGVHLDIHYKFGEEVCESPYVFIDFIEDGLYNEYDDFKINPLIRVCGVGVSRDGLNLLYDTSYVSYLLYDINREYSGCTVDFELSEEEFGSFKLMMNPIGEYKIYFGEGSHLNVYREVNKNFKNKCAVSRKNKIDRALFYDDLDSNQHKNNDIYDVSKKGFDEW